MTPEDELEAQYADQLVAGLPQDARERLLRDWGQYLVDRQQRDHPVRHRDFVLGWVACYDAHELRPRVVHLTVLSDAPEPPRQAAPHAIPVYAKLKEAQTKTYTIARVVLPRPNPQR